jgi:hypothetical protein
LNPLATILAAGVQAATAVAGVSVRYTRGAASVTIDDALLGRASDLADTENPESPRIEHSDRDFLLRPAAIVLAAVQVTPAAYDTITILDSDHPDAGKTYEVLATANHRPYASCDPFNTLLRVFTRQIA